jgi:NAD(P)-dependent dehydrogenase (short-subunit alcohol dehydrogenase family)
MNSLQQDKEKVERQKVAVVTGCSSGIGQEISLKLARNDIITYATMRDPKKAEFLKSRTDKEKYSVSTLKGSYSPYKRSFGK